MMYQSAIRPFGLATLTLSAVLVSGCANRPAPLYAWGSYQTQVYAHFKAQKTSPQEQLLALEKDLELAAAKGATPPPGFHAHMGLLHLSLGQDGQAAQAFLTEKRLFPESAAYVDFLMNKNKAPTKAQAITNRQVSK